MEGKYIYILFAILSLVYNWYKKSNKSKKRVNPKTSSKDEQTTAGGGFMELLKAFENEFVPEPKSREAQDSQKGPEIKGAQEPKSIKKKVAKKEEKRFENKAYETQDYSVEINSDQAKLNSDNKNSDLPELSLEQMIIAEAVLNRPKF